MYLKDILSLWFTGIRRGLVQVLMRGPAPRAAMRIISWVRYFSFFPEVAGGSVLLLFEIAFFPNDLQKGTKRTLAFGILGNFSCFGAPGWGERTFSPLVPECTCQRQDAGPASSSEQFLEKLSHSG